VLWKGAEEINKRKATLSIFYIEMLTGVSIKSLLVCLSKKVDYGASKNFKGDLKKLKALEVVIMVTFKSIFVRELDKFAQVN